MGRIKVSKEDIYLTLTEMYGWTPDQIANMNPYQQLIYLKGRPKITEFKTLEDYQNWMKSRG